jgi:hypothetical protein
MMATFASRFDVERLGMVPWASPRHSEMMIVSGTGDDQDGADARAHLRPDAGSEVGRVDGIVRRTPADPPHA